MSPIDDPEQKRGSVVPKVAVDAEERTAKETSEIFAAMVRDVFDAQPIDDEPPCGVSLAAWHLGTTMIGAFSGPPTRFVRDEALVAASGLDQFLVQLYLEGGFEGFADDKPMRVKAGELCVFDLAATLETASTRFSNISLLVPREDLRRDIVEGALVHGMVIDTRAPLGVMLGDHLRSIVRNIDALRGEEAAMAAGATLALVRGTLGTAVRNSHRAIRPAVHRAAPLRRAFDFIDAHIQDPSLDVDRITEALGCSRAALFRLFSGQGGVERYIRRRRLGGAARDLSDPTRVLRIGEIAKRWGFANDAAFSRAFRHAFGMSPRAARRHNLNSLLGNLGTSRGDSDVEERFMAWLRTLRFGNEKRRR